MAVKSLADLLDEGVAGRGVLVRCDLNVPLDDKGHITDPGRIEASAPTLKALVDAGAKVVVTAHLGRPKDGSGVDSYWFPAGLPARSGVGSRLVRSWARSGFADAAGPLWVRGLRKAHCY